MVEDLESCNDTIYKNAEKQQGTDGWDQEILLMRREGNSEEQETGGLSHGYNTVVLVISVTLPYLALGLTSPQSSWSDIISSPHFTLLILIRQINHNPLIIPSIRPTSIIKLSDPAQTPQTFLIHDQAALFTPCNDYLEAAPPVRDSTLALQLSRIVLTDS